MASKSVCGPVQEPARAPPAMGDKIRAQALVQRFTGLTPSNVYFSGRLICETPGASGVKGSFNTERIKSRIKCISQYLKIVKCIYPTLYFLCTGRLSDSLPFEPNTALRIVINGQQVDKQNFQPRKDHREENQHMIDIKYS